jgi:hypothetical protein
MVGVARSLPVPDGSRIEWLEGSAMAIPLADASFDVLLCQQGFQFFLDKSLALREMRRVLDRRGRLALSVWGSAGFYNSAVGEALARFVGEDSAARFCASRKVPAKQELARLVAGAGFSEVNVRLHRMKIHLPRLDRFVLEHLAGTPVAASIAALGDAAPVRAMAHRRPDFGARRARIHGVTLDSSGLGCGKPCWVAHVVPRSGPGINPYSGSRARFTLDTRRSGAAASEPPPLHLRRLFLLPFLAQGLRQLLPGVDGVPVALIEFGRRDRDGAPEHGLRT